jgi:hypothetical protein
MTHHDLDTPSSSALEKYFAQWLVEDSTPCARCEGPRDAHTGCDYCRERAGSAARLLIDLNTERSR